MENIEVIGDSVYLEDGAVKVAVYNTVHTTKYWRHAHRFFEFVYVIDGFSLHSYNNKTALLTAGDLFCVYPGDVHAYAVAYNTNIYNILFYLEELGDFREAIYDLPGLHLDGGRGRDDFPVVNVPLHERRELIFLLEKMRLERQNRLPGWELNMKALLTSFLVMYSRLTESSQRSNISAADSRGYSGYIYSVLKYIEENYQNAIDTKQLGAAAGVSPDYLSKQFKAAMSMTPAEYLRRFRLAKAMDLLKSTDLSISEIAVRTGFGDISLFSRVFKQTIGSSPAGFRKE